MTIAPRLPIRRCSITGHAIRRFRERIVPGATVRQAKQLISAAMNEAKLPTKQQMDQAGRSKAMPRKMTPGASAYWYHRDSQAFFVTEIVNHQGSVVFKVLTCWKMEPVA
jgi:hypothetical protein